MGLDRGLDFTQLGFGPEPVVVGRDAPAGVEVGAGRERGVGAAEIVDQVHHQVGGAGLAGELEVLFAERGAIQSQAQLHDASFPAGRARSA